MTISLGHDGHDHFEGLVWNQGNTDPYCFGAASALQQQGGGVGVGRETGPTHQMGSVKPSLRHASVFVPRKTKQKRTFPKFFLIDMRAEQKGCEQY